MPRRSRAAAGPSSRRGSTARRCRSSPCSRSSSRSSTVPSPAGSASTSATPRTPPSMRGASWPRVASRSRVPPPSRSRRGGSSAWPSRAGHRRFPCSPRLRSTLTAGSGRPSTPARRTMNAELASQLKARTAHRTARARAVSALGPLTFAAGLAWAFVQPYRITLLHPHGPGFWWLFVQPPVWRMLVGLSCPPGIAPAFLVSGAAFLLHEQNGWYFQRSSFLHHLIGWTMVGAAIFPLGRALRRRSLLFESGFALTFVVLAVCLYCDRDLAPIFGHLSPLAGTPHR